MRIGTLFYAVVGSMGVASVSAASRPPVVPLPAKDIVWGDDVPAGPPAMPSRRSSSSASTKASETEEIPYMDKMAMHRKLKADAAGVSYEMGHWSYGDYKHNVSGAGSVKDCATLCDDDKDCMHWQFQLEQDRCDHKTHGGRMAAGDVDWVVGHSKNYVPGRKTEL